MQPSFTFTAMAAWRKSTRSANNGACVEIAAWRKSSSSASGECVEVGQAAAVVGVRDTKDNGAGPVLTFSAGTWAAFTAAVKRGNI